MEQSKQAGITISWDASSNSVQATGYGFIDGAKLRNAMNEGLKLLAEKKSSKWLADMREQKIVTQEDQEWTVQEWTPKAANAGLKKAAIVIPKSALGALTIKKITNRVGNSELETAYFDNLEEARQWLRTK